MRFSLDLDGLTGWNATVALAVVFGLVSVPWTYGFVAALEIPLWPAFVGSATVFAAGGGWRGFRLAAASNLAGVAYAAATLAVVDGLLGGTALALSLVVGGFMFLASLHPYVEPLSYTPGAFFGFATMFSVAAASATVPGTTGLGGEALAAAVSMGVGALIGYGADVLADRLAAT